MTGHRLRFGHIALWGIILLSAIGLAWLVHYIADQFIASQARLPRFSLGLVRATETPVAEIIATATTTPGATFPPMPSGKIVFTCTRGGFNHICTINADGTDLKQLTDGPYNDYYGNFNQTGTVILFASNRSGVFQIYTMNRDGSQQTMLPINLSDIAAPELSPDGQWIVFAAAEQSNTSIWLTRPDGTDLHLLFGPASDIDPTWSPDGNQIAFASNVNGSVELFRIQVDGNGLEQITRNIASIGGRSSWSPDASQLVFYAGPQGDRDVYRVEVADGISTQLTFGGNNAGPCFSRNGNWIVFASSRDGDHELYRMRADGTDLHQITFNHEDDWQPRWGP